MNIVYLLYTKEHSLWSAEPQKWVDREAMHYRMPNTIVIYNYHFSGQWTRSDDADITDMPQSQKTQCTYKFQPVAQKKLTLIQL